MDLLAHRIPSVSLHVTTLCARKASRSAFGFPDPPHGPLTRGRIQSLALSMSGTVCSNPRQGLCGASGSDRLLLFTCDGMSMPMRRGGLSVLRP